MSGKRVQANTKAPQRTKLVNSGNRGNRYQRPQNPYYGNDGYNRGGSGDNPLGWMNSTARDDLDRALFTGVYDYLKWKDNYDQRGAEKQRIADTYGNGYMDSTLQPYIEKYGPKVNPQEQAIVDFGQLDPTVVGSEYLGNKEPFIGFSVSPQQEENNGVTTYPRRPKIEQPVAEVQQPVVQAQPVAQEQTAPQQTQQPVQQPPNINDQIKSTVAAHKYDQFLTNGKNPTKVERNIDKIDSAIYALNGDKSLRNLNMKQYGQLVNNLAFGGNADPRKLDHHTLKYMDDRIKEAYGNIQNDAAADYVGAIQKLQMTDQNSKEYVPNLNAVNKYGTDFIRSGQKALYDLYGGGNYPASEYKYNLDKRVANDNLARDIAKAQATADINTNALVQRAALGVGGKAGRASSGTGGSTTTDDTTVILDPSLFGTAEFTKALKKQLQMIKGELAAGRRNKQWQYDGREQELINEETRIFANLNNPSKYSNFTSTDDLGDDTAINQKIYNMAYSYGTTKDEVLSYAAEKDNQLGYEKDENGHGPYWRTAASMLLDIRENIPDPSDKKQEEGSENASGAVE